MKELSLFETVFRLWMGSPPSSGDRKSSQGRLRGDESYLRGISRLTGSQKSTEEGGHIQRVGTDDPPHIQSPPTRRHHGGLIAEDKYLLGQSPVSKFKYSGNYLDCLPASRASSLESVDLVFDGVVEEAAEGPVQFLRL